MLYLIANNIWYTYKCKRENLKDFSKINESLKTRIYVYFCCVCFTLERRH